MEQCQCGRCAVRPVLRDERHYNHETAMKEIAESVKNSAYEIIAKKHATYYGIAMSVKRICECIMRNEKSVMPVSSMMHGEYGI